MLANILKLKSGIIHFNGVILLELADVRPVQVQKSMKYSMKIRVQMPEPEIIGENGGR